MAEWAGFPCARCGECCRHVNLVPELAEYDRGDGVCIKLRGNLCGIYETRPPVCRVDGIYEERFVGQYSREEFYRLNLAVCRELMRPRER